MHKLTRKDRRLLQQARDRGYLEASLGTDRAVAQAWGDICEDARIPAVIVLLAPHGYAALLVGTNHLPTIYDAQVAHVMREASVPLQPHDGAGDSWNTQPLPIGEARGLARKILSLIN